MPLSRWMMYLSSRRRSALRSRRIVDADKQQETRLRLPTGWSPAQITNSIEEFRWSNKRKVLADPQTKGSVQVTSKEFWRNKQHVLTVMTIRSVIVSNTQRDIINMFWRWRQFELLLSQSLKEIQSTCFGGGDNSSCYCHKHSKKYKQHVLEVAVIRAVTVTST